jgi:hypothetical protein
MTPAEMQAMDDELARVHADWRNRLVWLARECRAVADTLPPGVSYGLAADLVDDAVRLERLAARDQDEG